jgi:hypothetical protein
MRCSADEELDSVAQWLAQVEAKLPLSTFKTLAVSPEDLLHVARLMVVLHELLSPHHPHVPSRCEEDHPPGTSARHDRRD